MSEKLVVPGTAVDQETHHSSLESSIDEDSVVSEDYTSSSGSSSEDDTEHDSDDSVDQLTNVPMRADLVTTGSDDLKARIHAILPAMQHANASLLERINNGAGVERTDIVDDGDNECEVPEEELEGEYVEMNLALGVLSEQSDEDGKEIKLPKRELSSDCNSDVDGVGVLENLQGRTSRAKRRKVVEELADG